MRNTNRHPGRLLPLALGLYGAAVMAAAPQKEDQASVCGDSRVVIVGHLPFRWHAPVASACASISAMVDRDETAQLFVSSLGEDLRLEIHLADGRTATRRVNAPAALAPTLEALLALPKPSPATPAVDRTDPPDLVRPVNDAPAPSALEFGGSVGARVAGPGPYLSGSIAAFVQMRRGRWLLGSGVRWDPIGVIDATAPDGFESEAFAVSLTVGRRLEAGRTKVDVGLSPRLVTQTQTALLAAGEQTDSDTDIRAGAFGRVTFGGGSLHLLLETDADVSPTRVGHTLRALPGFPKLPTWSAGVSAGVQWGEP